MEYNAGPPVIIDLVIYLTATISASMATGTNTHTHMHKTKTIAHTHTEKTVMKASLVHAHTHSPNTQTRKINKFSNANRAHSDFPSTGSWGTIFVLELFPIAFAG